jgi:hypothetical protein
VNHGKSVQNRDLVDRSDQSSTCHKGDNETADTMEKNLHGEYGEIMLQQSMGYA